jgi:hypothetical protein
MNFGASCVAGSSDTLAGSGSISESAASHSASVALAAAFRIDLRTAPRITSGPGTDVPSRCFIVRISVDPFVVADSKKT